MDAETEKVIFIVGGGHSGSTLIDFTVGSTADVFSVGELSYLDVYKGLKLRRGDVIGIERFCTCTERFNECPFWSNVEFQTDSIIDQHQSLGESLRILFNILNPFERLMQLRFNTGANGAIYQKIFNEARRLKPGVRYIMDSSKDPRRLYELVKDPEIGPSKLAVIHLVRDGRGYTYSYQKPERFDDGFFKPRSTFVILLEWVTINFLSRIIIWKYGLSAINVSYDQFAERPNEILEEIGKFLSIDLDGSDALTRIAQTTFHNVHGNPMRTEKIKAISRTVPWVTEFSTIKRWILTVVLYPFNRYWVYPRR